MTARGEIFLGIIAAATLMTALVQVGAILYGLVIARRIARVIGQIDREVKPLIESLNAMARDAARATSLASQQVQRVDRLFDDLTSRIDETAATVQTVILRPLRDGAAVMAGVRTALDFFRDATGKSEPKHPRGDDEDALFIG